MDPFTPSVLLAMAVILGTIMYLLRTRDQRTRRLPPGPRGLELLQEIYHTMKNGRMPETACRLGEKYGDIVRLNLGYNMSFVFFNNPADVREFFTGKTTRRTVNSRKSNRIFEMLKPNITLDSPEDGAWATERKLFHQALKFYGEGYDTVELTIQRELQLLVTQLRDQAGQDVEARSLFLGSIFGLMHILLTGEELKADSQERRYMTDFNDSIIKVFDPGFFQMVEYFPFLLYLPGSVKATMDCYKRNFEKMMQHFYHDMKATYTAGIIRGIVDVWLEKMEGDHFDWMTEKHVCGLISSTFIGGTMTTTEILTSMFLFLLNHPEVVTKIRAEVDSVVGPDDIPSLDHRDECPYAQATLLETLRVLSLLPITVGHNVVEDTEFKGYFFPKDTTVFANQWALHRSEALWQNALEFQPERFLDEGGQLLPATHPLRMQMLAFGVGMRSCPGESFARARIFLYFTTILHHFDLLPPRVGELPPVTPDLDSWTMSGVMIAKGYSCQFAPRQKKNPEAGCC